MPFIKKKINRNQIFIASFDDFIEQNSIARIIDVFVENTDLGKLGFTNTTTNVEGRPCYPAAVYVKLYMYGSLKNVRSSRKLAALCRENIEVMWLLDGLTPDFRSISDFRKINTEKTMKKLFMELRNRILIDVKTGDISVDGSKFQANNSKDNNFTLNKLDERISWLKAHCGKYLRLIDLMDAGEDADEELSDTFTKEELLAKLDETRKRLAKYESYREYMEQEHLGQLSLIDIDSKLMKNKDGMQVSYNIQTAVDTEQHIIMDYKTTNECADNGLLYHTVKDIKAEAGDQIIHTIADTGYQESADIINCLDNGIIPNVILPDGKDKYELEVDYEEANDCDPASTKSDELKKCLHSGIVPAAYEEMLEAEITEVRFKVEDEAAQLPEYADEEEMIDRATHGYFIRDVKNDKVYCPYGETLRLKGVKKNGSRRYANKAVCKRCPFNKQCVTSNKITWKEIDFGKNSVERKIDWLPIEFIGKARPPIPEKISKKARWHYETKRVVKIKFYPNRKKMDKRKCTSEHPFGTIKRSMDAKYFLLRGMSKVDGEFALIAMGYNLRRAINMYSFEELMKKVGRKVA